MYMRMLLLGAMRRNCCVNKLLIYPHKEKGRVHMSNTAFEMLNQERQRSKKEFPIDLAGIMRPVSGKLLKARGFTFFREDREYQLDAPDKNGIVRVYSKCWEEGPDEDGYGAMEYFDWWMMDTNLEPIPGIKVFYGYSAPGLFGTGTRELWYEQYDLAVKIMTQHKGDQYDE